MRHNGVLIAALLLVLVLGSVLLMRTSEAPLLIIITPTRDALTRYSNLLVFARMLAASRVAAQILWIVVEDAAERDPAIEVLLRESGVRHHYLHQQTLAAPASVHRGVEQRNTALDFVGTSDYEGIVYFADGDNAYRPELWPQLLTLPADAFTVFAVGNLGYYGWEGPVVSRLAANPGDDSSNGPPLQVAVEQWCCDYCRRRWNVDMGGFAFHTSLLRPRDDEQRPPRFDLQSESGFLESDLLHRLENGGASTFVILPELVHRVHVWHNYGRPFHAAGLYDADWTTEATISQRLRNQSDTARGFAWAEKDLPRARVLYS
ncbi:hypothetical protein JCM3770_000122 [Rhodotorula araucariae]